MDLSFLSQDFMGHATWLWLSFMVFVFGILFVDLLVLNKKDHVIGIKESLRLTGLYLSLGLVFGLWVLYSDGGDMAADYYTVWLLEQSLSMDNLFVMSIIFSSFAIPRQYQHRVLFWGILGVVVLRGVMIGAGSILIAQYSWVLYIFAAILIATGIKLMFVSDEEEEDYTQKSYVKFLAKHMRVDSKLHGHSFFVRLADATNKNKLVLYATPLFLCLCTIELTDVMFAFDSVPAAFAVTNDPYIIYTANIFAILGLRAMFFAMEHILHRFEYLKYSLSIVLIFIGLKVFYGHFFAPVPGPVSLAITFSVLAGGVVISMLKTRGEKDTEHMTDHAER